MLNKNFKGYYKCSKYSASLILKTHEIVLIFYCKIRK